MIRYIDAEKLINEIDRQEIGYNNDGKHTAEYNTCRKILDIITSLQQDQPEVDLEKEIEDWCDENITGVRPIYTADSLIYGLLPKTAHYFYELGLNARKEDRL